ncbi:MAG TPA: beta-ketoacyl-[acyl-carrier-protein] synthase family protein, partial [Pirellulales bacterium]
PNQIHHVNAHGLSTPVDDRYEAQAIRAVLGDVPVTAPKSFFGHLGAGCGAMELAASLIGMQHGEIPITLNYDEPDAECPVNIVHSAPLKLASGQEGALVKVSASRLGQAAAMVIAGG